MMRPLIWTPILELGAAFPLGIGSIVRQVLAQATSTERCTPAFQRFPDQGT